MSNSFAIPCSLPGSSVHVFLQARILEWIAISFSRGSSWPRNRIPVSWISCVGRRVLYHQAIQPQNGMKSWLVQFSSVTQSCLTLCNPMDCSIPSFPGHHQFLELTQTHADRVMPSNHLILCHPLLLPPSIFPSIRIFSNESALRIRWPQSWSFSFSISPSSEYSGLISFRINWLDLLAVQGTLKSLLQHHSLKALILWRSAFFTVQLSHSIHDQWKNHSLG